MAHLFQIISFGLSNQFETFLKMPLPEPTQMITQIETEGSKKIQEIKENPNKLIIKNYIFGMKQTGYFWQLLGTCEIVFGLMILSQYMSFLGALMLFQLPFIFFYFTFSLPPTTLPNFSKQVDFWSSIFFYSPKNTKNSNLFCG